MAQGIGAAGALEYRDLYRLEGIVEAGADIQLGIARNQSLERVQGPGVGAVVMDVQLYQVPAPHRHWQAYPVCVQRAVRRYADGFFPHGDAANRQRNVGGRRRIIIEGTVAEIQLERRATVEVEQCLLSQRGVVAELSAYFQRPTFDEPTALTRTIDLLWPVIEECIAAHWLHIPGIGLNQANSQRCRAALVGFARAPGQQFRALGVTQLQRAYGGHAQGFNGVVNGRPEGLRAILALQRERRQGIIAGIVATDAPGLKYGLDILVGKGLFPTRGIAQASFLAGNARGASRTAATTAAGEAQGKHDAGQDRGRWSRQARRSMGLSMRH